MKKIIMLLEAVLPWCICIILTICLFHFASLWLRQNAADQFSNRYYNVMLSELKERIESGLKLGVDLSNVPGIQNTLRKIRDRDHSLYALEVTRPDNVVVFSTDRGSIGETLPDTYLQVLSRSWSFLNPYETFHSVKIRGVFGENAGQVLLSASRQKFDIFNIYQPSIVLEFFCVVLIVLVVWLIYFSRTLVRQAEIDSLPEQAKVNHYLDATEERLAATFLALQVLEKRYS